MGTSNFEGEGRPIVKYRDCGASAAAMLPVGCAVDVLIVSDALIRNCFRVVLR